MACVLDLFSRKIVGLAMSDRMKEDLVMAALGQVLMHRRPESGLLHHSDKGSQYTGRAFQRMLAQHHITVSMSGTGHCYDNAAMESFFHTLKMSIAFEKCATWRHKSAPLFAKKLHHFLPL